MLLGLDCCHKIDKCLLGERRRPQDIEELRHYFRDFDPPVQKLISYVKEAYAWNIKEIITPSWLGRSGRVVLIGDAAHASLPWSGQVPILPSRFISYKAYSFREEVWHLRMQ
jgi:hypothetical protein